jgi:CHAD domain-containing protein
MPDAVHQMRVACRRMRSAVQTFGRIVERDRTRELTNELKWLAGELGPARDAEVMAERFTEILDDLPEELKLGPVRAELTRAFQRRYTDGHTKAIEALNSERYLALHRCIDALLADPPMTRRAQRPATRELTGHVRRVLRRLQRSMDRVHELPAGPERELATHDTRKDAKRLRYAIEAIAPTFGKTAEQLRKRLKAVQEVLGDFQDAAVARPVLRELAVQAHGAGGNGFTYGLMYGLEQARAAGAEDALDRAWKRMESARATRWLDR